MIRHSYTQTAKIGNRSVDLDICLELYEGQVFVWSKFDEFEACDSVEVKGSLGFIKQYIKETGVLDKSISNLEIEMQDKYNTLKPLFGG